MSFQPQAIGKDGVPVCGITTVAYYDEETISIDVTIATDWIPGCVPQWAVLRHELACHALISDPDAEHTATGICSAHSVAGPDFDQISLDAMCSVQGC